MLRSSLAAGSSRRTCESGAAASAVRALLLVLTGLVAWIALPGSASAETTGLELSADGHTFVRQIGPLFPSGDLLVPGDRRTEDFWIRNSSSSLARMTLSLKADRAGSPLLVTVTAPTSADPVHAALSSAAARWMDIGQPVVMKAGAVVKVSVTIAIPAGAPNADQRSISSFVVKIGLGQSVEVISANEGLSGPAADNAAAPPPAGLSSTGVAVGSLSLLAAGLAAAGVMLLLAARRRRRSEGGIANSRA